MHLLQNILWYFCLDARYLDILPRQTCCLPLQNIPASGISAKISEDILQQMHQYLEYITTTILPTYFRSNRQNIDKIIHKFQCTAMLLKKY